MPDDNEDVLICLICGHENDEERDECSKCKTPFFSKEFQEFFKHPKVQDVPKHIQREIVMKSFSIVPGITVEGAEKLYKMGFKNFSDLVGKTLQDKHRKSGLHRTIARRIILTKLDEKDVDPATIDYTTLVRCVACQILIPKAVHRVVV